MDINTLLVGLNLTALKVVVFFWDCIGISMNRIEIGGLTIIKFNIKSTPFMYIIRIRVIA